MPEERPPAPTRWKWTTSAFFVFSYLQAALSVGNALATGSFSRVREKTSEQAVYAGSAVLETAGLLFGVIMGVRKHWKDGEQSLWREMLSEPYLLAAEGIVKRGARGGILFLAGLRGALVQAILVVVVHWIISRVAGETSSPASRGVGQTTTLDVLVLCVMGLIGFQYLLLFFFSKKINARTILVATGLCFGVLPTFYIEAAELVYLVRSDVSIPRVVLILGDALAIVALGAVILVFWVFGPLYGLYMLIGGVSRTCCRSASERLEGPYPLADCAASFLVEIRALDAEGSTRTRDNTSANLAASVEDRGAGAVTTAGGEH